MKDIYLISCTKSKQSYPCKAEEMYLPSAKFRASLEYADNRVSDRSEQIYIISAKHGLLALDEVIEPYNETLIGKSMDECDEWGERVAASLAERFDISETNFIILAGYSYVRPLLGKLKHIGTPLSGMTMGVSISWLQQHRIPGKDEKDMCVSPDIAISNESKNTPAKSTTRDVATGSIPKWEDLLEILRVGTELQTINHAGKANLWILAKSIGKDIQVSAARNHSPSSKASPRRLTIKEYDDLSPYYLPWRQNKARRGELANISQNSSYIFALINHFAGPTKGEIENVSIPKPQRFFVPAAKLRDKQNLTAVPGDEPGWYRWWAPEEALKMMLDSPHLPSTFYDRLFPHLKKGEGKLEEYYSLYVGVAINESIRARLDWHINQVHTRNNVYHGSLSTLRQTISSLLTANQASEAETNAFIDLLHVEFQAFPLPIKSREARELIDAIENKEIRKTVYPLNIRDNNHEVIQPFRSQLSQLRQQAKQTALTRGFKETDPISVIESMRGVMSDDLIREELERQNWLKYNYPNYLGDEPLNVDLQLRKTPTADFDLCCALLTLLLREEHFCEGSFGPRVQEGSVGAILDRMKEVL